MGPSSPIFNANRHRDSVFKRIRIPQIWRVGACLGGMVIMLSACAPTVNNRGHLLDADRLAEIHPGETNKDQVAKLLGTPSSVGVFDDKSWYYISRKTEQVAFFDKDLVDQQIYVIDFDNRGVVKQIGRKDLQDARLIEPAPGATPAPGRELTFIEQIIGNVGRFSSGAISSTSGGEGAGK
jgi:outer membrane protein assembly factor BamE (lipoprotein component of BamABCDE complex)